MKKAIKFRGVVFVRENLTIHKPATIRRYVGFSYNKVKIRKNLHDFEKYSMFVSTINLQNHKPEWVPKSQDLLFKEYPKSKE